MADINRIPFSKNSTYFCVGVTNSGKSFFVKKLLSKDINQHMFETPIDSVLWCYSIYQKMFDTFEKELPNVTIHEGLPTREQIMDIVACHGHVAVVLDDLQAACADSKLVEQLVTCDAHHVGYEILILAQNLYPKGRVMRNISLNMAYLILFKSIRTRGQLVYLNSQLFPNNKGLLPAVYDDVVLNKKYAYLLIDLSPHSADEYRLRTSILPDEQPVIIYTAK